MNTPFAASLDESSTLVLPLAAIVHTHGDPADELLALMCAGQPLLTVVADKHLTAWRAFSGGYGVELPPERAALERWFSSLPAQRSDGTRSAVVQAGRARRAGPGELSQGGGRAIA